jgi:large repetitive protein
MNMTPIAKDDVFTVKQGTLTTTITGNLGADNGSGVDSDPDGTLLGWVGANTSLVGDGDSSFGAFFSNGVLGFMFLQSSGYVTFPVFSTTTILTTAAGGQVILQTNGSFVYTAPAGFSGVDYVDYALVDGVFATDIGRVTFNVTANPDANAMPVAADDVFNGFEDTQIIGNVLLDNGNGPDIDPNGDTMTVTNQTIFTVHGGRVSISANGDFVYTPAANYNGPDSFIYTVSDIHGAKDTATVTLNIAPVQDAPIARDDAFSGVHSKPISGNVLANDTDADNDPLTAVAATITTAAGGLVTLLADGNFTYVPNPKFVGVDSFDYTVLDGQGNSDTATVSLNVLNHSPTAITDWYSAAYGQNISGNVLLNDSDADGDVLSVAAGVYTTAHGGTVKINADGTFTYKAADAFYGTDFFDYSALDGFGGSSRATSVLNTSAPSGAVYGTSGLDNISGTGGDDYIYGMADDDVLYGLGGNDTLVGGDNKDTLWGDTGDDKLYGQSGRDVLQGGVGNDTLSGGLDVDDLYGGDGVDVLVGGAGIDKLTGGNGNDQFVFDAANGTSADRVMDFKRGDLLVVNAADYGLTAGLLPDASYFANAGAANVDHGRFLYNSTDRSLSWDADGNAATANVTIATFNKSVTLSDSDFLVI